MPWNMPSRIACAVVLASTLVACSGCAPTTRQSTARGDFTPTISEDVTAPALYQYEASKETTIKDESRDLSIYASNGYLKRRDGDSDYLVGLDGNNMLSEPIRNVESIRGDTAIVMTEDPGPHNAGIVNLDKGVLVKPEAALIKPARSYDGEPRFAQVAYATGEAKDVESGFVYVSDSGLTTYYDGDGYAAYEGYARVFDLEAGDFVDGLKLEQSDPKLYDFGDTFLVCQGGRAELYDPSGKRLWAEEGSASAGAHSFFFFGDDKDTKRIIGADGKTRFTADDFLIAISGPDDLYSYHDDTVIDMNGNVVLECPNIWIWGEAEGMYEMNEMGNNYKRQIIDGTGKRVCEGSELERVLPGYARINTQTQGSGNRYSLYSGGELVASNLDWSGASRLAIKDGDQRYASLAKYYVFADHACTLGLTGCTALDIGLVYGRTENGAPLGVYDLFTGEEIIPAQYDKIGRLGSYVFARADDTWDVYRVQRLDASQT